MIKKLLFASLLFCGQFIAAQSDEATDATPLILSNTFDCENAALDDFEGFTKSPEFTCVSYDGWVDSWYTFTPAGTEVYALEIESTNSSNQDVRIGIYTGTPGSLTSITGCATRYYSGTLNAGQTYYINARGASVSTAYRLCAYKFPATPTNDEPEQADVLTESTFEVCENAVIGHTTSGSYTNETTCSTSNPDVWYAFTPSETAEYTFRADLVNGAMPLYIGIYTGTPGFLNPIGEGTTSPTLQCSDMVLADLTAGNTYYISVTSPNSSQAIYFSLCGYISPAAPANDDCTTPTALTVGNTFEDNYIVATTTSASVNYENSNFPACGTLSDFAIYGRDVWFTVVVPESGTFIVETREEPTETNLNDTAMEAYTGSCGTETLEPYYYNLPPPNTGQAYCSNQFVIGGNAYAGISYTNKTPGETVFIRVWGWAYQFGKFRISAYDPSSLSINETVLDNELSYYPNPVNETLHVSSKSKIARVEVYNLLGKKVKVQEVNGLSTDLKTTQFSQGMYLVRVYDEKGNSQIFKILKE